MQHKIPKTRKFGKIWLDLQRDLSRALGEYGLRSTFINYCKLMVVFPGIHFVIFYRLTLMTGLIPIVGRPAQLLLWSTSCHIFNSEISVDADIGGGLFVPHPYGIVIGGATIGSNAAILQNVTIGMRRGIPGSPIIGDDFYAAPGATLFGKLVIGDRVTIGANAVVLTDVPPNSTAVGVPARVLEPGHTN